MPVFASDLASERPEEIAVRDPNRAFTWAQVGDILNRTANNALSADLGPKRRVAVFAENAAETAYAHLGCLLGLDCSSELSPDRRRSRLHLG